MPRTRAKPAGQPDSSPPQATAVASLATDPEVLTLAKTAAYLRVSEESVLRMVQQQGLPGRNFDDDWRFLKRAIQDWLRAPPGKSDKQLFWQTHFGALKDDPFLEEMLKEIYQQRGRPETEESE